MRDFLLRLLGAPRQINVHVHVDPLTASIARPGDTVIVAVDERTVLALIEGKGTRQEIVDQLVKAMPGVRVLIWSAVRRAVVVSTSRAGAAQ